MNKTVSPPDMHKDHSGEAKQLFFLLRNAVVRDAHAYVHGAARKQPHVDLDGLIFDEYDQRRQHKYEPFKVPLVTSLARDLDKWMRANPFDPEARLIRAEIRGSIFVQLRS